MTAPAGVNDGAHSDPAPTRPEPVALVLPAEPAAAGAEPAEAEPAGVEPAQPETADAGLPGPQGASTDVAGTEDAGPAVTEPDAGDKTAGPGAAEPDADDTETYGPDADESDADDTAPDIEVSELDEMELDEAPATRDMSPLAIVSVIVLVIVLVGAAAGVLDAVTHGFHRKTVVTYKAAPVVFSLRPGECIDTSAAGLAFTRLACSTPHDAEVFATFTLTGSWPGTNAVEQDAANGCAGRLSSYLNPALATAALTQSYVYPDDAAWKASERTVICEVSSSTGQLTGSVRKLAELQVTDFRSATCRAA